MRSIQNVYISGLGAVGSAYAAKLYEYNPELVTVIADTDRIQRYRRAGIIVNQKEYSFKFIEPEIKADPADLIIIAVKQHHLHESITAIRHFVGEKTIILSLLNGITSEEVIGGRYGSEKLLYSFVVGTDSVREGNSTRYTSIGKIVFGEKDNRIDSPKVQAVKELFDATGIPYEIPKDILREIWWKWMMNVGINQVSAILKAPYGVFQKVGEARALMEMAAREVLQLAEKVGIQLSLEDLQTYFKIVNSLSPQGKTSMLQDIEAGRKTEVEGFAGTVLALGRQYGVETPVNEVLFRMMRTLEQTYTDRS
jgi:2-dehydropantoate 2-reductase